MGVVVGGLLFQGVANAEEALLHSSEYSEGLPRIAEKKLPPLDAVAIKSWSFLKKSMENLGTQTEEVVHVRQDMANMEEDIKAQQLFWDQAKTRMTNENAHLKTELKRLDGL